MSEAKRQGDLRLSEELRHLQTDLRDQWIDRSLPEEWNGLGQRDPVAPKKQKVTLRLDEDMLRWFRKLGPGYNRRINSVLRIYWDALLIGRIKSHWDDDGVPVGLLDLIERKAEESNARRADRESKGAWP